jgi:predicted nucleic acid-binding protein
VILIDANILFYAYVNHFPKHQIARNWLDDRLNGPDGVGLTCARFPGLRWTDPL